MGKVKVTFEMDTPGELAALRKKIEAVTGGTVMVERVLLKESKGSRFDRARSDVEDATGEVESLATEMEEWRESLPESMQDGEKASTIEEAAAALRDILDTLESLDWDAVEFPA